MLVRPSFLRVTFTTALPLDSFNPLKVITFPLFVISTWSSVNGSVEPSGYVIEYLSASNGSKNTLVIPTEVCSPTDEENVIVFVFIFAGPPVICFVIIRLESARLTFDIFSFGNGVNIPDPSRF